MKIVQSILDALKSAGIGHLFLVPGQLVDPFTNEISRDQQLKGIVAAHESGAVAMADGYARATGNFGAALCIGGPGITNTLTGIYTAYMDRSPILVMSGEVRTDWAGKGLFQDTSDKEALYDVDLLKRITRLSFDLHGGSSFDFCLHSVFKQLLSGFPKGPVHLAIPMDVQLSETDSVYRKEETSQAHRFLEESSFAGLSELLSRSKRIAILAGYGTVESNASQSLIRFAQEFEIPVATTLAAKGVFPESHRLALGVFGWTSHPPALNAILSPETEVLIVLGSRLSMQETLFWHEKFSQFQAIIQVDRDENNFSSNFKIHYPILGDCALFLDSLREKLKDVCGQENQKVRSLWIEKIRNAAPRYFSPEDRMSPQVPLHPARVVTALRKVMPDNTLLAVDNGAHTFFAAHYWDSQAPRQFFSSVRYVGPMGWAIPAGIGIKFAKPEHPCVVVTGDGCMLMHGVEIQTAARYGLDLIVLVLNNSAYGNVYLRAQKLGAQVAALQKLPTHDWSLFANALGAKGARVEEPEALEATFRKALKEGGVWVIDARCGNYPTPTHEFEQAYLRQTSTLHRAFESRRNV